MESVTKTDKQQVGDKKSDKTFVGTGSEKTAERSDFDARVCETLFWLS